LIGETVVTSAVSTAPYGDVPYAAWLAADRAWETSPVTGDELHTALAAADPHIRLDELEHLRQEAATEVATVSWWRPWRRAGPSAVLRLLARRREELIPLA
jgi:hypothetical protein